MAEKKSRWFCDVFEIVPGVEELSGFLLFIFPFNGADDDSF